MPLSIPITAVERLLFTSDLVALGTFRCEPSHALFEDSGPCNSNVVVFPRHPVRIEHRGGVRFLADPTIVPLYNCGQEYRRVSIGAADHSDWIVLADDVLADVTGTGGGAPFGAAWRPSSAVAYLTQRRMFETLLGGDAVDALDLEETAVRVVGSVFRGGESSPLRASDADVVERVKTLVAADVAGAHSLRGLARSVDMSPFRLCRVFRAATGTTLTRYLHSIRLRIALGRVRRTRDLSALAADLGFASHSHFTALFRRHFGVTPAQSRAIS
jgi:AraC family transcriptional regulator